MSLCYIRNKSDFFCKLTNLCLYEMVSYSVFLILIYMTLCVPLVGYFEIFYRPRDVLCEFLCLFNLSYIFFEDYMWKSFSITCTSAVSRFGGKNLLWPKISFLAVLISYQFQQCMSNWNGVRDLHNCIRVHNYLLKPSLAHTEYVILKIWLYALSNLVLKTEHKLPLGCIF